MLYYELASGLLPFMTVKNISLRVANKTHVPLMLDFHLD